MQKFKSIGNRNLLITLIPILTLVLAALIILIVLVVRGDKQAPDTVQTGDVQMESTQLSDDEFEAASQNEQDGTNVVVQTAYCDLKYPFAMSDVVQVERDQRADVEILDFMFVCDEIRTPLFTLSFGNTENDLIGTITMPTGDSVDVHLTTYDMPESLQDKQDAAGAYFAALEILNDILDSLNENPAYRMAG